jgi:hypothetical protein
MIKLKKKKIKLFNYNHNNILIIKKMYFILIENIILKKIS